MAKPKSNKLKKEFARQKNADRILQERKRIQDEKKALKTFVFPKKVRNLKEEFERACKSKDSKSPFKKWAELSLSDWTYNCCLHLLDQKVDLTNEKTFTVICNLSKFEKYAFNPVGTWISKSYNLDRQLSSLMLHLYAKYEIPTFMDKVWNIKIVNFREQEWFVHVGKGLNIRKAIGMPVELTKKEAHYMMKSPKDFDVNQAIRYGQVVNLGGDEHFARQLFRTRIAIEFTNNEFWMSVFRWFLDNPMLDPNQYGPIIDYILNQKFDATIFDGQKWVAIQPNFSMKGRDVNATIKQVEAWHKSLGKQKGGSEERWLPSGIVGLHHETKKGNENYLYRTRELLTKKELVSEGNSMHHCVSSYSYSCVDGSSSIWSLEEAYYGNIKKLLTLQINRSSKTIVQARGKYNAAPSYSELELLRKWCNTSGLSMGRWM